MGQFLLYAVLRSYLRYLTAAPPLLINFQRNWQGHIPIDFWKFAEANRRFARLPLPQLKPVIGNCFPG